MIDSFSERSSRRGTSALFSRDWSFSFNLYISITSINKTMFQSMGLVIYFQQILSIFLPFHKSNNVIHLHSMYFCMVLSVMHKSMLFTSNFQLQQIFLSD